MKMIPASEPVSEPVQNDSKGPGRGRLYVVGTPIGNLEDITLRALRTLRECDLIACEDTRHTQKLLNHFEIKTRATSYHEHNEKAKAVELLRQLEGGKNVALVCDAGMPLVSDPGYRVVELCVERGVAVIPVPGPSAVLAALTASGLPSETFQFVGFAPPKRTARRKFFERFRDYPGTTIFFETPHRVAETLAEMIDILGDRRTVLGREITKLHEEFLRGRTSEVLFVLRARPSIKGEMTILVGPAGPEGSAPSPEGSVRERVDALIGLGTSRMEALKTVARERNISKSQVYRDYQAGSSDR
jgi:16S rRNA (cytidine1402-2'-O)-methyltransferase